MESEVIETVLKEVLEELKEVKHQQITSKEAILEIKNKAEAVDNKKIPVAPPITGGELDERFDRILRAIEDQPKSITKQFKVQLFPEHGAMEYYKIIFGRLLFWMMAFLIATYLFVLMKNGINGYSSLKEREVYTMPYKKAWNYLYNNSKKSLRIKMDSVWNKRF